MIECSLTAKYQCWSVVNRTQVQVQAPFKLSLLNFRVMFTN
jgi:hypothetical protein